MAYYGSWMFVIGIVSLSGSLASVEKREVTTEFYPDCDVFCKQALNESAETGNFSNVVYVRSVGSGSYSGDIIHMVLSTVNVPSILMIHTTGDKAAKVNFNWEQLLMMDNITDMAGAVNVSVASGGAVKYSFAVVFTKLIEYEDTNDAAKVDSIPDDPSLWNIRNFTEFSWMNATTGQNGRSLIFKTNSTQPEPAVNKTAGSMYFEFEINKNGGRDDDLPRLIFSANNTQMNFVLDGFVPMFNHSRFALETVMVSQPMQSPPDAMAMEESKSIDDEYSPGVFRVVNWYSQNSHRSSGGYIQYKPVCYLEEARSRSAGTEVSHEPLSNVDVSPGISEMLDVSLVRAFFANQTVVQRATNISFGLSQDGFYVKNNYTAWTTSIGYGSPPDETISQLVIIIIAAGLGIPVVVIVFGGIYVIIRKLRSRRGYQQMDNVVGGGGYAQIN